jgi:hypothetical protein
MWKNKKFTTEEILSIEKKFFELLEFILCFSLKFFIGWAKMLILKPFEIHDFHNFFYSDLFKENKNKRCQFPKFLNKLVCVWYEFIFV